jgi:hypothetical protein
MCDLHLCLSPSVNVRSILHTQLLVLYNKIFVGNLFVLRNFYPLSTIPFIAYLIYFSDGKHKEPNANAENNNATNPPPPSTL